MSDNKTMISEALNVIDSVKVDKQLALNQLKNTEIKDLPVASSVSEEDSTKVDTIVDRLMGLDFNDGETKEGVVHGLRVLNDKVMEEASQFTSEALKKRMGGLQATAEGDVVFQGMMDLNAKLKEVHPSNYDLTENFFHKILPFLSPVRNYFAKFQTMESVIGGYQENLERGIEERELDLDILREDKKSLYNAEKLLKQGIEFNKLLQDKLETKIKMDVSDASQKQFLEGQILSNLLRQTQGLEEMRAVNLQGQMSMEMLLKTGLEVIDGAKRCIRISINALTIAGVIQHVLTGQRKLLEAVTEVNKTATQMVDWNAKQLSTTMIEVGRMASETSLDIDVLINAIEMSTKAIDDDIKYRQEAIPMIKERISRLGEASNKAQKTTDDLAKERGIKENFNQEASAIFA
jgi:uncharacterized protein YaaN involved in tellurite resistance